ncbi:MAG: D-tyrosyl-tRNA(Tyr) deacylase [Phycisphaerae bacterium]|nr:D-aminoacyl-tRNA deacylase [Phycisphaerae bacterium]NUQ45473.1 D-tyrosyl-tRNA(Tyr) deacylase [Phycisphaerae bacterium]
MRCLVERVLSAIVRVEGDCVGRIDRGLLVYVGIEPDDAESDARLLADKVRHLRIFPDDAGKMNRDVGEIGGAVLAVSAFSLAADARKGRRPSFDTAAPPEIAEPLYATFVEALRSTGIPVQTGVFRAMMAVEAVNDGPITLLLDSKKRF